MNHKMEEELTSFKAEVAKRFAQSTIDRGYKFPKMKKLKPSTSGEVQEWETSEK